MTAGKKVTLAPDVAAWIEAVIFPAPETGRQPVAITVVPGTPDFDQAVDLYTRAKTQLGG